VTDFKKIHPVTQNVGQIIRSPFSIFRGLGARLTSIQLSQLKLHTKPHNMIVLG